MENNKKYWKGLEELHNAPEFSAHKNDEFLEPVPLDEAFTETDGALSANRRDFLKYFGFSVSAVALAACNTTPVKNVIPYVNKPENITPGVANWYASTCGACSASCGILVKTREGRPIKIEGNNDSSVFSKGGVCGIGHASLLGLYDNERLRGPQSAGKSVSWSNLDAETIKALSNAKNIRIISAHINSPSSKKVMTEFTTKFPSAQVITYEPYSYAALIEAQQKAFGKSVVPGYRFDEANVIVSFGADFLGTWISPVEFTKAWVSRRKLNENNSGMSRHIQFESTLTVTGSNADMRYPIKPSSEGVILISLYNKIAALAGAPALNVAGNIEMALNAVELTAKELWNAKGKSIVVSGSNSIDNQLLVAAINSMLGNIGSTIDLDNYSNQAGGNDAAFENFVKEMNAGSIDAVIFNQSNPAYSYYNKEAFVSGLKKVAFSLSTSSTMDETAELCKYQAPDNHFLESWNDAEPKAGYYSLTQPTISNVFDTRQTQESFLRWAGNSSDFYTYLKNNWTSSIAGSESAFNKALHDGYLTAGSKTRSSVAFAASLAEVSNPAFQNYTSSKDKTEFTLYTKVGIGNGKHANNPWLQELPDPISKVCWDNYLMIGKVTADKLNLKDGDLVNVKSGKGSIDNLPVLVQPGQANNTVSIALGYGQMKGKIAVAGKNAYGLASFKSNTFSYSGNDISIEKASGSYKLAQTQTHHTIEGRNMIREASLSEYHADPKAGNHFHSHIISLWDEHEYKGHRWGMAIDMNACTGCGSCVVSCNAENNVPVVGRDEILRGREMHWIRIDRYYSFKDKKGEVTTKEKELKAKADDVDYENVSVNYQAMMCQQCGHAPCETVCPVLATVHSSEGLNQMAYNRCVGTRYCANNCPYKVRRFNWFKYRENDQFDFNMNNDLGRMVLNPDVTVRSRGVMEKCSFCVQRIQSSKLTAKMENRDIQDGDIKTACQQSCPANAIVFGDMNDPNSELSKLYRNERSYVLLEEYNVQPSVAYLTKIRNVDGAIAGHHAEKHESKSETKTEAHHS